MILSADFLEQSLINENVWARNKTPHTVATIPEGSSTLHLSWVRRQSKTKEVHFGDTERGRVWRLQKAELELGCCCCFVVERTVRKYASLVLVCYCRSLILVIIILNCRCPTTANYTISNTAKNLHPSCHHLQPCYLYHLLHCFSFGSQLQSDGHQE